MKATEAQIVLLEAQTEAQSAVPRVTSVDGDRVNRINILPGCVDIFLEDGSRIFVYNAVRYSDGLKMEAK